jgi:hypothetical protein
VLPPLQFAAIPASNSLSGDPILPGSKVLLKSLKTDKYCRVVDVAGTDQIKCDVTDPTQATPIDYTGTGFSYKVRLPTAWREVQLPTLWVAVTLCAAAGCAGSAINCVLQRC